jgi:cytochrome c biogenesis protein ResB
MIYTFLSSVKLALGLLIVILVCCIAGVTIYRDKRAWELIFSTFWFNGILVLLVVNVAFCFFGRIWGRKVTLISFGMILFHLSFVAMLGGIIYNSLFYFHGLIRLTEGETLPNENPQSYDVSNRGRLFDQSRLKGETTLIKMHTKYKVNGDDKMAAYEIAVGEGRARKQGIVYITQHLDYRGFRYYADREGYSLLITLHDRLRKELYGAHIPLQSFKQKDDKYLYMTGTKDSPAPLAFPQDPLKPLFDLQVTYLPTPLKERAGDAVFQVWQHTMVPEEGTGPFAEGKAEIGGMVKAGNYYLSAKEVRYWVAMSVRYDPGQPIVLASLWVGLGGMIITFIGRMKRGSA